MPDFRIGCLLAALMLTACGGASMTREEREQSANTQLQLGIRYLGMDKLKYAQNHLNNALAIDNGNVEVHNALGYLHEKLEQPEKALAHYREALAIETDNISVLNNIGRFLCARQQREQGLDYLTQALGNRMNNRLWITSANIGYCHLDAGDLTQAQAYFKQSLNLRPDYAPALLAMQRISYELKDYWAAKGYLGRYLATGQHTAQTLWYAYQCERALGHVKSAHDLRQQLINQFPLSAEAQKLLTNPS